MHLKQSKRKDGRVYLSIVRNYREGKQTKTRTVKSLGYLDELEQSFPDPIAHFRAVVDEMNAQAAEQSAPVTLSFNRNEPLSDDRRGDIDLGATVTLAYLNALGVSEFFANRASSTSRGFNKNTKRIFELLVHTCLIGKTSTLDIWRNRESFPLKCPFTLKELRRQLPAFASCAEDLIECMDARIEKIYGRAQLDHLCEIETTFMGGDSGGSTVSWPPRVLSIIADTRGVPLGYRVFTVYKHPQELGEWLEKVKEETGVTTIVEIADKGPDVAERINEVLARKNEYVFSKSSLVATEEFQQWILDNDGYVVRADGRQKVKSRSSSKNVEFDQVKTNGSVEHIAGRIPVREIAFWSYLREVEIREARTQVIRMTEPTLHEATLVDTDVHGERSIHLAQGPHPELQRLAFDTRFDGYYCIVTNRVRRSDIQIIDAYRQLWHLEGFIRGALEDDVSFQCQSSLEEYVQSRFLIAYVAYVVAALICHDLGGEHQPKQAADALKAMRGLHLQENWYLFTNRSEIIHELHELLDWGEPRRLLSRADVRAHLTAASTSIALPRQPMLESDES